MSQTPPLILRLPPTEPKADRERKKFQRAQALERNMATLRQGNPPQYGQNISRTAQNANRASRMDGAMADDRLPTLQRAQIPDRERIWNGVRVADRGAVMEKGPSLAREPNIEQGGTMGRGRRRHHPDQTHQSYAAQRDMRTRRYQQVYGANPGAQPKPRSRPGQHCRNEHNTQRSNAYNAPNNIANQAGPRPRPHEQRLTSRAMEEKFAREISTIAVVQKETLNAVATKPGHVRREKQQAKEFADRAIAEVERQVELQQYHANINDLAHSRLSEMPLQPLLVPLANGTVVSVDPQSYLIYQAMYPPHLPPGYMIPPGYPVPLPRVVTTMPPNAPPPPVLRVFPPTMQPVMPVFHSLVPPPPADPRQSSQHIYATSQYKMCNYVDVRAEERHRNPVRIQGAGHLEYEKELWARHLSDLREESLLEDAEFVLLDPRQGQRVSQMNSAYRSGPSCFMPPRYSLSPKPEVEYVMRRPRDPLPDLVPMSGSTSGMSTPTLSYRRQHGIHRLNAEKLRERLNKLSVEEGKRPERPSSSKPDSPKAKNLTYQVISRPEPVNAAAVNGAARKFTLAVREKGKQNDVANKQVNGGRDETNLAEKSFLGNTIFGEVPGHVSREPSPKARAGGRRGRRLFERSPARNPVRSPVHTPPNQRRPPRVCLNLSPEWLWKQGGSISSDKKPVDSS